MEIMKHCVFCGQKPQDKSKEHVIPRWLIELTGDPSRSANFGFSKDVKNKVLSQRTFAFDKFTFQACSKCNQKFSSLEAKAKQTINLVLSANSISVLALSEMFDWFDKVRIGLWLGMRLLDKDIANVQPNFHIETRIGQHDRLLIIEKSDFDGERLNFVATDTLNFALTPSAFMLIINNYHFTNISTMSLCARRLGFPFVSEAKVHPERDEIEVDIIPGRERVMHPVLRRAISEKGKRIYQPMFRAGLAQGASEIYDCDYVRQHSIDFAQGVGNIFADAEGHINEFRMSDSINLDPDQIQPYERLNILSGINILEWQLWLHKHLPSMELLSKEQRRYVRTRFGGANRLNRVLIQNYRNLL